MGDRAFIDTNIFIYIQRSDEPVKKKISEDLQDGLIINDRVKVVNIFKHFELLENTSG
jgi:predicted nucleic acid-binding protein